MTTLLKRKASFNALNTSSFVIWQLSSLVLINIVDLIFKMFILIVVSNDLVASRNVQENLDFNSTNFISWLSSSLSCVLKSSVLLIWFLNQSSFDRSSIKSSHSVSSIKQIFSLVFSQFLFKCFFFSQV